MRFITIHDNEEHGFSHHNDIHDSDQHLRQFTRKSLKGLQQPVRKLMGTWSRKQGGREGENLAKVG
jgi:hypothetical protein